jgi:hypothetical protein
VSTKKSLKQEIESKNREMGWLHHRLESITTVNRMLLNRDKEFDDCSVVYILDTLRKEVEAEVIKINTWMNED